ncbi:MAG: sugar phosphate isomerase/epimerase [Candidatus Hydrogenedentes bacterium]|nr:sugar phosphate isomerase/epimerase [Candidatus Hydrogenedentota bacterium]
MCHHAVTRRDALKAGIAAAALPLAGASAAAAAPQPPVIGISTLGFPNYTNEQLAQELAAQDIHVVQLFLSQSDSRYWKYNGRSDLADLSPERCERIANAYRAQGVSIHSIGVYTNLIHPDDAERDANLAYFDAMMAAGDAMGVHTFITEAGHHEPEEPPGVPYYLQEPVWLRMVETGKRLAALAEKHDATVLLEPFYRGFLTTAKRTRLFVEDIGSPRIRVLLDPANLLELNDMEEMFAQLQPWIDCLHAKDRKLHVDRGVAAGKGDLNYDEFVALAAQYAPHAPFILEYVGPNDYLQARDLVEDALNRRNARVKS